jgi:hypothetical protein
MPEDRKNQKRERCLSEKPEQQRKQNPNRRPVTRPQDRHSQRRHTRYLKTLLRILPIATSDHHRRLTHRWDSSRVTQGPACSMLAAGRGSGAVNTSPVFGVR